MERRVEIEGRKHGETFVEFFESSTIVGIEQAVDEGSFASANQDVVRATFRLKEAMGWKQQWTGRNNTVVGDTIEDDILAQARRKIVDGLESLVGEAVEFKRGVESDDGVPSEGAGDTVSIQGNCRESTGINAVCYLPYPALFFQALEQVQKRTISLVLLIEPTRLIKREDGCGLGELGKGQLHNCFSCIYN